MAFPQHRRFKPKITEAERRLCARLKKEGIPFKSQAKVKTKSGRRYLVDLLINESIIVEVGYVGLIDVQEDEDLRGSGYTVLRIKNKEVTHNIKKVVETIKKVRELKMRGGA
jgi:very-short-patch-repair endonuclease